MKLGKMGTVGYDLRKRFESERVNQTAIAER